MKNLTEELFRYSVVTSSQELKPERMDVVRALEESLLSFYAVMQEKGIQSEIDLPEEPVYRELDAGATGRIFANIISNALKYLDGDLVVKMASRNSTGLGLSIAKLLIERMGGTINILIKF